MSYEYKVVPAPVRGLKAKGVRTAEDRFANALQDLMNTHAEDRWEYLRTDTLPCEQREGLLRKSTVYQNMLVFRRTKEVRQPAPPVHAPIVETPRIEKPVVVSRPVTVTPPAAPEVASVSAPAPSPSLKTVRERIGARLQATNKDAQDKQDPDKDVAAQ